MPLENYSLLPIKNSLSSYSLKDKNFLAKEPLENATLGYFKVTNHLLQLIAIKIQKIKNTKNTPLLLSKKSKKIKPNPNNKTCIKDKFKIFLLPQRYHQQVKT